MFTLIDDKKVTVALGGANDPADNMTFLQSYLQQMLKAAFPHLTEYAGCPFFFSFLGLHFPNRCAFLAAPKSRSRWLACFSWTRMWLSSRSTCEISLSKSKYAEQIRSIFAHS